MNQPVAIPASGELLGFDASRFRSAVMAARDAIIAHRFFQPRVGIILGSGLGALADRIEHPTMIAYSQIPYFPQTYAAGHDGQLLLGFLAGMPVVAMRGRGHRYEGRCENEVSFPVHCMHALGIDTLFVTNAAGGVNPRFNPEDLMLIDSHIDLLWRRGYPGCDTTASSGRACYDLSLIQLSRRVAQDARMVLHQGCYLATLGPTYETRAEYRMFRQFGADAVGMSTVPEVLAARNLGLRLLACSVITNVASPWQPQSTTHDEVVQAGAGAGPNLLKLVLSLLEELSGQPD
jgi:purine-nucleoside phosphorylase